MAGSFAVSRGAVAFIHSQTADYIVSFIAVATTATPFAYVLSLPFIYCPHIHMLPHSHSPTLRTSQTHVTHRPIPERGYATRTTTATADVGDPSTELFGFPVSYVGNLHIVDKKATVCKLCRN